MSRRITVVLCALVIVAAAQCVHHDYTRYPTHIATVDIPHGIKTPWDNYLIIELRERGVCDVHNLVELHELYEVQIIYELDNGNLSLSFLQGARVHSVNIYRRRAKCI